MPHLWEIRIILAERSFRLVYADLPDGLTLLALHAFVKKSQRAPKQLEVAVDRYRTWRG